MAKPEMMAMTFAEKMFVAVRPAAAGWVRLGWIYGLGRCTTSGNGSSRSRRGAWVYPMAR